MVEEETKGSPLYTLLVVRVSAHMNHSLNHHVILKEKERERERERKRVCEKVFMCTCVHAWMIYIYIYIKREKECVKMIEQQHYVSSITTLLQTSGSHIEEVIMLHWYWFEYEIWIWAFRAMTTVSGK